MWTCPKCGAKVDSSFDVCWQCGTTADGVEDPNFLPADAQPPGTSPLDLDMPLGDAPIPDPIEPALGDLVAAYWALDLMQAKFLADRLSEDGIPAVADTQDLHDALGTLSSAPRVWVRAQDLAKAKEWLDAYDRQFKAEHGGAERD